MFPASLKFFQVFAFLGLILLLALLERNQWEASEAEIAFSPQWVIQTSPILPDRPKLAVRQLRGAQLKASSSSLPAAPPSPLALVSELPTVLFSRNGPQIPSSELLLEEVKKDPHSTPASLIVFADQMADRLKEALDSEELAHELFHELAQVSLSQQEGVPEVLRVYCLRLAVSLNRKYASLTPSFEKLFLEMSQTSPELADRAGH